MNSIFLRAKHWQLFVPQMVIPFVTMIIFGILATITITAMEHNSDTSPEDAFWIIYCIPVIFILCGFVQFAWFWSIFTKLEKLVPKHIPLPLGRIKFFFVIPIIYFCLLPFYIVFIIQTLDQQDEENLLVVAALGIVFVLLHFFSIFCMIHSMYFAAKIVRSAELQKNARFSTFAGYFFLIWIFPVGVWFIQPKINKLVNHAAPDGIAGTTYDDLVDN